MVHYKALVLLYCSIIQCTIISSIPSNYHTNNDLSILSHHSFAIDQPTFLRADDELPTNFSYLCEDDSSKHAPAGLCSVDNLTVAWIDKDANEKDVMKLQKHCR